MHKMTSSRGLRLIGLLAFLSGAEALAETRYAVLAGCDTYEGGLAPLNTSVNDIQGMKDSVLCAATGYWLDTHTVLLKNSQATRQRVRDEIAAAAELCRDGDVFFFMYSGHGAQDYDYEYFELLCLYDYDYGDWELGEDLALFSSGVKIVVLLDTCYSGGMFKAAGVTADQLRFQKFAERVMASYQRVKQADQRGEALVSKAALGANVAFMTACNKFELSWTSSSGYSVYAGYVLDAAESPLADANSDGRKTFKELHDYAVPKVVADTQSDEVQTPQSYHPEVLGSIVVSGEPAVIRMESSGVTVSEGGRSVTLLLSREGAATRAVSAEIMAIGETAVPGKDFTVPAVKTVTWAAGDLTPKSVTLAITDDTLAESDETFWVQCANAKLAVIDELRSATLVTIEDNDTGVPGSLRFAASAASAAETLGFVPLSVTRTGGSDGAARVHYRTIAGSATAGADYVGLEGTLAWGAGDGTPRAIQVPVLQDAVWEEDETFLVELSDASGAALGAPAAATITIKNSGVLKAPGKIRIAPAALSVCESEGVARVTVLREGGSDGAVEAAVATVAGTAKAGVHFVATNAVLRWAHGDAAPQIIDVALRNDGVYKPDLAFRLQLGALKGGAAGATGGTVATVTLRDALSSVSLPQALGYGAGSFTTGLTGGWYGQQGESVLGNAEAAQLYSAGVTQGKDAWMQTAVTGSGVVGFWWRGAAQAQDTLQFLIGSTVKTQLVGVSGWQRVEGIVVPTGKQTLKWRFLRVSSVTNAADTAWVDQVTWQPDAAKPIGPAPATGGLLTSEPRQVAWQAAAGAGAYNVYLGSSTAVQTQLLGQTSETALALPALAAGATVYWRVDAVSVAGRVTKGVVWSFKVPAGALARVVQPDAQTATQGVPFSLTLALREGSPAATGYSVKGLPPGLTATAGGVIGGRASKAGAYAVTVAALNGFGAGPSEAFTLTVNALPAAMTGSFAGLSGVGAETGDPARKLHGAVQMTVSVAGALSGSVRLMDGTFSFSGVFQRDAEGIYFEAPVKHKDGRISTVQVWPYEDPSLAQQGYRGILFNADEACDLVLTRNAWLENKPALAEYAGYYTVALPLGDARGAEFYPTGTGYLTVKLEATGAATVAGVLSDGTAWSSSTPAFVAPDGEGLVVPVFAPLYKGVGQLWGTLRIAPNGTGVSDNTITPYLGATFSDAAASSRKGLVWYTGVQAQWRFYPDGFDLDLDATGATYHTGAVTAEARLGKADHLLYLSFDPISEAAYDPSLTVALSGSTIWLPPAGAANLCGTTLSLNGQTGLFSGAFTLRDTVSGKTVTRQVTYKGVLAPLHWTFGDTTYESPGSGFFTVNGLLPSPTTSWIDSLGTQLLWVPLN